MITTICNQSEAALTNPLRAKGSKMTTVSILILAAGASSRMRGRDKLMERIGTRPLLRRQVERALATGLAVQVAVPALIHPRTAAFGDLPVGTVAVPDAARGMSASLVRGVKACPEDNAILILPGDMPDLSTRDLEIVIEAFKENPERLYRGASDGTPGHPVLFPPDCRNALLSCTGDKGARDVVKANAHRTTLIPLPGENALTDLDTPEAWDAWRNKQS